MGKHGPDRATAFQLRFYEELHQKLKLAAAGSNRSLNTEIVHRLEASFEASKTLEPEIARALDAYIEAEVASRLRRIAYQLGNGEAA